MPFERPEVFPAKQNPQYTLPDGINPELTPREIAANHKTAQNMSLVETLSDTPGKHTARVALAANIMRSARNGLDIDQCRVVLMHMADRLQKNLARIAGFFLIIIRLGNNTIE